MWYGRFVRDCEGGWLCVYVFMCVCVCTGMWIVVGRSLFRLLSRWERTIITVITVVTVVIEEDVHATSNPAGGRASPSAGIDSFSSVDTGATPHSISPYVCRTVAWRGA
jgi:hypothetical protein